MSDYFIHIIPASPTYIPTVEQQNQLMQLSRELWPGTRKISTEIFEKITLIDCGGNFESIHCPFCKTEITVSNWHELMDRDFSIESGFKLKPTPLPCCDKQATVNDLIYIMPMGFSRFALILENIDGTVTDQQLSKLESTLKTKLKVIHQKY